MLLLSLEFKKVNRDLASLEDKEEVSASVEEDIYLVSGSLHFAHLF